jgi:FkbM family methyltransferase
MKYFFEFIRFLKNCVRKLNPNIYNKIYFFYYIYIYANIYKVFNQQKGILIYCGVNEGESLAKLFFKYKKCYCFEPNTYIFQNLKKRFNFKNVNLYNKGVADKNKKMQLNIYESTNHDANASFGILTNKKVIRKQSIEVVNLYTFIKLKKINKINKLILDVEGYDFIIIKSLKSFLPFIENIQHEYIPNGKKNIYYKIKNCERDFDLLLNPTHLKVGKGFGNLVEGEYRNVPNYRFQDLLWKIKKIN